jgi:acetyl-CoA C-acetyltransferase
MASDRPVIIGVGQITNRTDELAGSLSPLGLMAEAAGRAEQDAGVSGLLAKADSVQVVNIISWPSETPAEDLASRLGARPSETVYTTIGGNTPQWLVNETAERIVKGDVRLAVIAGAEAMHSVRLARKAGRMPPWESRGRPQPNAGDTRPGVSEVEQKHGATLPVQMYPMFENAIRAHHGHSIDEHQREIAELCARFAAVARDHRHAWFRDGKSAAEIMTVTPGNRMIAFPYPKFMNSIIEVDQGAALLLASESAARELGVAQDRWVYLWGCGEATDHWFVTERVNYHSSPAIRIAGRRALAMAGAGIDDVAYFDLYSCFPSAVQMGRDALDIAPDDPRPLTVTGGLPYFGGPGNNYTTHGIATMVEKLRADPGALGLVTALGWFATKHAVGVYGARPPTGEWQRADPKLDQAEVDAMPRPELAEAPDGPATVETYTVVYDRDGTPERGIVIGRLDDRRRFIAATPPGERALLDLMVSREFVGERGAVRHDRQSGTNTFSVS